MATPSSTTQPALQTTLSTVQQLVAQAKQAATSAVGTMAAGSVDANYVFNLLNQLASFITLLNAVNRTGLDAYATAQVPGYAGSLSADITANINAAQACIDWVVNNFPKDSTNTFILAFTLNADGSRTPRSFTSAQTTGFRTALNNLLATIG